ncbi:ribonuclease H-like domain-containing protein [Tanacetum coccineum]
MWIFLHKYLADGTLSGYKARLVVNDGLYSSSSKFLRDSEQLDYVVLLTTVPLMALKQSLELGLSALHLILLILGFITVDCKYATEILERAGMVNCNSSMTSVDTESKLGDDGDPVRVLHVHSRYQYVDIYTKGLPSALFEEFDTSLSVRCPLTPTAGHNIEDEEKHLSLLLHSSLRNPKGNVSAVPKPRGLAATGQKKAPAKNKSLERRWSLEDSLDELEVVVVVECEVSLENKVMMECYIVMEEVEVECDCHLEVKVEIEHEAY